MTTGTTPALALDTAAADAILSAGIAKTHIEELDKQLKSIHAAMAAEQKTTDNTLLIQGMRAWTRSHQQTDDLNNTAAIANKIRDKYKVFILVGIGGSDLGGRTLHDTLDHPYYNQLEPEKRGNAPEIYFTGDTFDPKRLLALLDMLDSRKLLSETCIDVVSKSGKTGETIGAALVIRERLRQAKITRWTDHFVATTGQNDKSVLFNMNQEKAFFGMLPVPEGVGGRFSFASPVGLLPLAVTAVGQSPLQRIQECMAGYEEAGNDLLSADSLAFKLARWLHLGERFGRKTGLIFCNYADDARLTDWFVQLYEESVQERGEGLNVIGSRGPTGNHSILNGILRGPHDKLVLLLRWLDLGKDLRIPENTNIGGDLESFEGLPMSAIQDASCRATAADYLANGVPTATLTIARRNGAHLFRLMRTFMDAVAIKGLLQNLQLNEQGVPDPEFNLTYQQPGVEGYKIGTVANARQMKTEMNR